MSRFLTVDRFIELVGEDEARQIAGDGLYNSSTGAQIVPAKIEAEIAFTDELIAGYVLARHSWLAALPVSDVPNLLQGIAADIVRYRLRDEEGGKSRVTDVVDSRHKDAMRQLEKIQMGKLDLIRDISDGEDLAMADLHNSSETAQITGDATRTDTILKGYL